MICKYCGAELAEDITLCPSCGQDNAEPKTKKPDVKKVIVASCGAVLLLAVLVAMLYYGLHGVFMWANDILSKDNYTVTEEELSSNLDKVVATLGEDKLTNEELQIYYWMQYREMSYYYSIDTSKPLHEQIMDEDTGMTWQQYLIETALENWNQYQALEQLAKKANFVIPEEYQKLLADIPAALEQSAKNGGYATVEELLAAQFGKGVTMASYQRFCELYYTSQLYFFELVDNIEVTDAELEAYYNANQTPMITQWNVEVTKQTGKLVDVRHVLIRPESTKDENGKEVYTEAAWEACRQKAQSLYDDWKKGTRDEITFSELAYNNSADGNKSDGGIYEDISKGVMVKEFEDWCFDESRKYGDHGLVKTEFGYHIMFYVGGEEGWKRFCRDGVQTEKADTLLNDILKENAAKINYKKIVLSDLNISTN